ncbi:olfactory receptor 6N2-like isoform X2 [Rhinatrema bivittatum]|uniref:olfactory receptor 6N2-like isoform X2 n=1 Tax=Rhinatrema bivittatum TaxID=194408 RepID=UPI00112B38B8|nr:olfactory receptor 6N2-like isoform X2 [Rhinatrema bivittatum]
MKFPNNNSTVTEFIIAGFSGIHQTWPVIFTLLLVAYLLIIIGNLVVFLVIQLRPHLHVPMYFFISVLSFLELWYTAVTIPKMLSNLLDRRKSISFSGCFLQVYFFHSLGITEIFLLTTMAYDRYLAICTPLHYPVIMTSQLGLKLAIACWILGFLYRLPEVILISRLPFCGPNVIEHIFCDLSPLLTLACTDTSRIIILDFAFNGCTISVTILLIGLSYIKIIQVVLNIQSSEGRRKAFSTCATHLIVVVMFFGSVGFMYIRLTKTYSLNYDKTLAVVYSVITPLCNPVIYSLRNKEIREAIWKIVVRR